VSSILKLELEGLELELESIAAKLRHKLSSGVPLSAAERHIGRSIKIARRGCFGPSISSCLVKTLSSVFSPVVLVFLISAAIILNYKNSPSVSSEKPEVKNVLFDLSAKENSLKLKKDDVKTVPAKIEIANEELEDLAFATRNSLTPQVALATMTAFNFEQTKDEQTTSSNSDLLLKEDVGLVKFISGMIAVFYPAIENCGETSRHIVELSREADLDPLYVASVIASESGFRANAKSSAGATGLMQLLPSTAKDVSGGQVKKLTDPLTNIKLGIKYLKELEARYRGNKFLALAAYNWGYGNIDSTKISRSRFNKNEIPRSVRNYSTSILERTLKWQKHFKRAAVSSEQLLLNQKGQEVKKS
jgi:Transglycosylase SLT domain